MARDYTVRTGDCIMSIAHQHGFFWQTLWNHADNACLKQSRTSPTILKESDVVRVPELVPGEEFGATETRHRFRRKGVPVVVVLRIRRPCLDDADEEPDSDDPEEEPDEVVIDDPEETELADEAAANAPYTLDIDGKLSEGETDGGGEVRIAIPPGAQRGRIVVAPGTPHEQEIVFLLGGLDPIETPRGIAQRLSNLGFGVFGGERDVAEAGLAERMQSFQRKQGLEPSGRADDATRDKLKEVHGS